MQLLGSVKLASPRSPLAPSSTPIISASHAYKSAVQGMRRCPKGIYPFHQTVRPSASKFRSTNPRLAGRSANRRMKYGNHCVPKGTYTRMR